MATSMDAKLAAQHNQVSSLPSGVETQIKETLHFTQHAALRCVASPTASMGTPSSCTAEFRRTT